jgi:hypothetical protein
MRMRAQDRGMLRPDLPHTSSTPLLMQNKFKLVSQYQRPQNVVDAQDFVKNGLKKPTLSQQKLLHQKMFEQMPKYNFENMEGKSIF